MDNTQLTIFGGFAPNSSSAEVLSKSLGSRTVMSGIVHMGKKDISQSLQIIYHQMPCLWGIPTIVKEIELSEATVNRAINDLKKAGVVETEQSDRRKGSTYCRYIQQTKVLREKDLLTHKKIEI